MAKNIIKCHVPIKRVVCRQKKSFVDNMFESIGKYIIVQGVEGKVIKMLIINWGWIWKYIFK